MLIKKNLSTTDLKLIALFLMLVDHIYLFFSYTGLVPVWFTWLGRLSLPLFFFSMAEAFYHTRSRRNYMLRLLVAFLIMEMSRQMLMAELPRPDNFFIPNNIFGTMLLSVLSIYCLEQIRRKKDNIGQRILFGALLFIIAPLTLFVEGGWFYVLLGVVLYYTRLNRLAQAVGYVSLSLLVWAAQPSYQWMMVFAAPLMLLYSGQKGRGYKYLFYVFYPVHIWVLYILSVLFYFQLLS